MSLQENELFRSLQFQWMKFTGKIIPQKGPNCLCSETVHPGLNCFQELLLKFKTVIKTVSKFYLIFHLIPFLMKIKKAIREKKVLAQTFKAFLGFCGSIVFMAHLVCGLKGTICTFSNLKIKIEEPSLLCGGPLTAISILWQSKARRQEIAYYAFVRSVRAVYMYLLRRNIIKLQIPKEVAFVCLSGFLSYLFLQKRQILKYSNIFKGLWGQI